MRYRFWAERDFLHSHWERLKRTQLRGPQGDWLIEDGVRTELVGRENRQSQEELSDWVAIAKNFLALATPSATRIVQLEQAKTLDFPFPTGVMAEQARGLEWLSMQSPDFRIVASGNNPGAVYQAYLGLDKASGEVRLAILHDREARRIVDESTVLVEVTSWAAFAERRLPKQLRVYRSSRKGIRWALDPRPAADLYLLSGGTLTPEFKPEDFLP